MPDSHEPLEKKNALPFHKMHKLGVPTIRPDKRAAPVYWMGSLALVSLSLAIFCWWGAYWHLPSPENDLQAEVLAPKNKTTGAAPLNVSKAAPASDWEPVEVLAHEPTTPASPLLPLPVSRELLPEPLPIAPEAPVVTEVIAPPMLAPIELPVVTFEPPVFVPPPPAVEPPLMIIEPAPIAPAPPAPLVDETCLIFTSDLHPGDTPMIRNWKTLALFAFMVGVTPPPVVVAQDNTAILDRLDKLDKSFERVDKLGATLDKLDTALQESFKNLHIDLGTLKNESATKKDVQIDLDTIRTANLAMKIELEKKIDQLRQQVEDLRVDIKRISIPAPVAQAPAPILDKAGIDEFKEKLSSIEQAILKLQPNTTTNRLSLSPPMTTGRIVLANEYSEEMLFVVNSKPYRVAANSRLPLDSIPAGSISYEVISPVWGSRANRSSTLAAGETVTLTAR